MFESWSMLFALLIDQMFEFDLRQPVLLHQPGGLTFTLHDE